MSLHVGRVDCCVVSIRVQSAHAGGEGACVAVRVRVAPVDGSARDLCVWMLSHD